MISKLLTYFKYGNRFCGIEHTIKNGSNLIYASVLKQSKKELLIESSFEEKSIKNLSNKINKNQHVTLIINNDNVLAKTIKSEQQDALKLAYKAFPNINLDEFYFEVLSQKSNHFITLCRRNYVNNLVNEYTKQKLWIIDISLGNNLIGSISDFLDDTNIYTSNAKIDLKNKQVLKIEKDDIQSEKYNINGLEVSSNEVLSFSGSLKTVLKNSLTKTNFAPIKDNLLDIYKQTRFFNQFLKFSGVFLLGLLLVNFFFFNHYFNKVNELKQIAEINQSTKTQILKLDEVVSKKQKMVDDLLKSDSSKSSYYSNEIIHSLPNSILLKSFDYQPLLKRIKENKDIELKENTIAIGGSSNNSEEFSNWISELGRKGWIFKINILNYGSTSSKVSDFKIQIILEDD